MSFHPAYFKTRFRVEQLPSSWPESFVIVTAYATTSEQWSDAENKRGDEALTQRLAEQGGWGLGVIGYDPVTGHAELGWALEVDLETGIGLGREFRQDAIYRVEGDRLVVVLCGENGVAAVGGFRERVDSAATQAFASKAQG